MTEINFVKIAIDTGRAWLVHSNSSRQSVKSGSGVAGLEVTGASLVSTRSLSEERVAAIGGGGGFTGFFWLG